MAHAHADVVRKGFDAFAHGDMEGMDALLTDDVIWHVPGHNQWSGTYKGKEEVFRFFGGVASESQISNEIHTVLADDEHAVALVHSTISRHNRTVQAHSVFTFHFRGDQVSECWTINDQQQALDDVWS